MVVLVIRSDRQSHRNTGRDCRFSPCSSLIRTTRQPNHNNHFTT